MGFIQSYLSERQQKTKVNNAYSTSSDISYGVPQGAILGPLLFDIYIIDMFYDIDNRNIASYADDNTTYTSDFSLEKVIQKLELITKNLFKWLKNNRDTDVTAKIGELVLKIEGKKNFLV